MVKVASRPKPKKRTKSKRHELEHSEESENFDDAITPESMRGELDASEAKFAIWLAGLDDEISRYATPGFMGKSADGGDPNNHAYEWIVMYGSQLVIGNPIYKLATDRVGYEEVVVQALQRGLNRWTTQTDLRGLLSKLLVDYSFRQAVVLCGSSPRDYAAAEGDDPDYLPWARRVSPRYYRSDALSEDADQDRWRAHLVIRPFEEVLDAAESGREPGWNLKLLRELAQRGTGLSNKRVNAAKYGTVERNDFAYWEIWVRGGEQEFTSDEGFNGRWYTLPQDAECEGWIRDPRDAFGLREGPFVVVGSHYVMDENLPLAPLIAHAPQAEVRNVIKRAIIAGVAKYGRLIATKSSKLAEALKRGEDLSILEIDDVAEVDKSVATFERGGITPQMLTADEIADADLQKVSGLADFLQGSTSNVTATEIERLAGAAASRIGYDIDQFQRIPIGIAKRVLFEMVANEDVITDLGPGQPLIGRRDDGTPFVMQRMRGDLDDARKTLRDFEALNITIEPRSMSRSTDQRNALLVAAMDQHIEQIVRAGPQTSPYIDWDFVAAKKEELLGLDGLQRIANTKVMREFGALMMKMQQAPPAPTVQPAPQARMGFDVAAPSTRGGRSGGAASFDRGTRNTPQQMLGAPAGKAPTTNAKPQRARSMAGAAA